MNSVNKCILSHNMLHSPPSCILSHKMRSPQICILSLKIMCSIQQDEFSTRIYYSS